MDPVYSNSDLEPMVVIEQHNGRELPAQVIDACMASRTQYNTLERFLIDLASGGGVNMTRLDDAFFSALPALQPS